jgi:hypothetical protein
VTTRLVWIGVAASAVGVALAAGISLLLLFGLVRFSAQLVESLPAPAGSLSYQPSPTAVAGIPPLYLHLYEAAAAKYRLDWTILAGIGTVECDNGQDPAPSCHVPGALNYAGAGGPAQFLIPTFREYGVTPTGQGTPNMWNPADAIYSMANYLRASGAPGNYPKAIFAYNHAWWYVSEVLSWARRYRSSYPSASSNAAGPRQAPTETRHHPRPRGQG